MSQMQIPTRYFPCKFCPKRLNKTFPLLHINAKTVYSKHHCKANPYLPRTALALLLCRYLKKASASLLFAPAVVNAIG